jgi:hypothetical protein
MSELSDKRVKIEVAHRENENEIKVSPASYDAQTSLTPQDWEVMASVVARQHPTSAQILFSHGGDADASLSRRPETDRPNYHQLIEPLKPTFEAGTLTRIHCTHEAWCDSLNRRGNCNCNPVVEARREVSVR